MSQHVVTALSCGLLRCQACGQVSRADSLPISLQCARCGETLQARGHLSLQRTAALVAAAAVLYIPANVLPIMHTSSVAYEEDDTILSGVVVLWSSGSWPLAILVLFASILVPMLKLIGLSVLVIGSYRGWQWRPRECAALYRLIEFIGRWSMLDVFVVTLLVSLVQLRGLATIHAGWGAAAFALVVILTIFAAHAFDPRLIWDRVRDE